MVIGVDGTGSYSSNLYMSDNAGSFVWQAVFQSRQIPKRYFRGPELFGTTVVSQADAVVALIKEWLKYCDQKVYLAGHSRGGAISIVAAQKLEALDIPVECLALFDAVQMAHGFDAHVIPGNVKYACHAVRSREVGSRSSWGNCGLFKHAPGELETQIFPATHAGVGGTPWTGDHPTRTIYGKLPIPVPTITEEGDRKGSATVKEWMWPLMRKHGML